MTGEPLGINPLRQCVIVDAIEEHNLVLEFCILENVKQIILGATALGEDQHGGHVVQLRVRLQEIGRAVAERIECGSAFLVLLELIVGCGDSS